MQIGDHRNHRLTAVGENDRRLEPQIAKSRFVREGTSPDCTLVKAHVLHSFDLAVSI